MLDAGEKKPGRTGIRPGRKQQMDNYTQRPGAASGPEQLALFEGSVAAPTDPLVAILVELPDNCSCAIMRALIGSGVGPHHASLYCASCHRHRGWVSRTAADFISKIIDRFGRPTELISVRRGQYPLTDSSSGSEGVCPSTQLILKTETIFRSRRAIENSRAPHDEQPLKAHRRWRAERSE